MQNPTTRLALLLGTLLLLLFPLVGFTPLRLLLVVGFAGFVFQLAGELLGEVPASDKS